MHTQASGALGALAGTSWDAQVHAFVFLALLVKNVSHVKPLLIVSLIQENKTL